jgi:hypothetical protein
MGESGTSGRLRPASSKWSGCFRAPWVFGRVGLPFGVGDSGIVRKAQDLEPCPALRARTRDAAQGQKLHGCERTPMASAPRKKASKDAGLGGISGQHLEVSPNEVSTIFVVLEANERLSDLQRNLKNVVNVSGIATRRDL